MDRKVKLQMTYSKNDICFHSVQILEQTKCPIYIIICLKLEFFHELSCLNCNIHTFTSN